LQNSILIAIKRQGTTSQAAERSPQNLKKRQGTTSVVPKEQQSELGFSPCALVSSYLQLRSG
jgi:hypothetical protein